MRRAYPTSFGHFPALPRRDAADPGPPPMPALSAALHRVRDGLAPADALYVGARLPYSLRGSYFAGWAATAPVSGRDWRAVTAARRDPAEAALRDLLPDAAGADGAP